MKVLFCCSGLHGLGGTAKHLTTLTRELRARGYDAKVLAATRDKNTIEPYLKDRIGKDGFELIDISGSSVAGALKFLGAIRRAKADTIVSVFAMSEILTSLALFLTFKKPKRYSLVEVEHMSRSYSPRKRKIMTTLWHWLCAGRTNVVTVNPHLVEGFAKNPTLIPLGAPKEEFAALAAAGRERRVSREIRVLFVGRFVADKGIPELLDAVDYLAKQGMSGQFRFQFVGEGPLRSEIARRLAKVPGLRFELRNWTGKISENYRSNDVLVLPSHHEGLPWVVVEALASGCVVVGSPIPAVKTLLANGRGMVLHENDGKNIAVALISIAQNGLAAYKTRLEKNQAWAQQEFSLEKEISAWMKLL